MIMRSRTLIGLLASIFIAACQQSAPVPATSPPATVAAKSAESPAVKSGGAPVASPAASPAASPVAASRSSQAPAITVNEAEAERYFTGKTITITVGFSPGGGYDLFARIMAEYMPAYIPGNPKFVVTNQAGANSLLAWQTVMRKTPGTGLDIAVFSGGLITQTVLGEKLESFDLDTPTYIGAPDNAPRRSTVCV
ncbi:MAG TPA: hypothetical protein VHX16_10750, partial [Chloroflexota bacterium]|nr:hypothetical protein [Chloroflexota bacterium]